MANLVIGNDLKSVSTSRYSHEPLMEDDIISENIRDELALCHLDIEPDDYQFSMIYLTTPSVASQSTGIAIMKALKKLDVGTIIVYLTPVSLPDFYCTLADKEKVEATIALFKDEHGFTIHSSTIKI